MRNARTGATQERGGRSQIEARRAYAEHVPDITVDRRGIGWTGRRRAARWSDIRHINSEEKTLTLAITLTGEPGRDLCLTLSLGPKPPCIVFVRTTCCCGHRCRSPTPSPSSAPRGVLSRALASRRGSTAATFQFPATPPSLAERRCTHRRCPRRRSLAALALTDTCLPLHAGGRSLVLQAHLRDCARLCRCH